MKKICIIGGGTYGSYLANAISEKYKDCKIQILEVGNENIKTEDEIGYISNNIKGSYNGAKRGRYFGYGGASAMWGGQLLFFTKNDFSSADEMNYITDINIRYKDLVLDRFFKTRPDTQEYLLDNGVFIKKGIWLKFNQRNMFQYFKIIENKKIEVLPNCRVIKLNYKNDEINSVTVLINNIQSEIKADLFYLTCGALEGVRVLAESGLTDINESTQSFSDHVSVRSFKIIKNNPFIKGHDFTFKLLNGSLITTRIVGEIENISYFVHPIYNEDFVFFQFIKNLIFKRVFNIKLLVTAIKQFFHLFPFAFNYLLLSKLYFIKPWYLNIDIELDDNTNSINLSDNKDSFNQSSIDIKFEVPKQTLSKIVEIKSIIRKMLNDSNIEFEELNADPSSIKLEDVYHPYKLFSKSKSFFENHHPKNNLFIFNTGLLNRSGGINPTATLFCLIENHVEELNL